MLCHAEQLPCGNIEEPAMAITDWPTEERPREKLLQRGPAALSDAELLAIFLRTGVRGKTAVDLARDLLREYGGLRALLEADQTRFAPAMASARPNMFSFKPCWRWAAAICSRH